MELLFLPFQLTILVPPLALLPGLGLALWGRRIDAGLTARGRWWVRVVAATWVGYALYESAVWRWSQGVTAPIRVDLLVIAPVLAIATTASVVTCWRAGRRE